jgi:endonuclease III
MQLPGVGPKMATLVCTLLPGLVHLVASVVDVHDMMRRGRDWKRVPRFPSC